MKRVSRSVEQSKLIKITYTQISNIPVTTSRDHKAAPPKVGKLRAEDDSHLL